MPDDTLSRSQDAAPGHGPLLVMAVIAGVALAGAGALWAHYGPAVFFEMIRAGLVACFG